MHLDGTYCAGFESRRRVREWASSFQIVIYPNSMLVNKTEFSLLGLEKMAVAPSSSEYVEFRHGKSSFKVPGYSHSD